MNFTAAWDDLRQPDEATLRFTEYALGGSMRPEDSADYLNRLAAACELPPNVPDRIRGTYDQARGIFALGLFNYDVFTAVRNQAVLAFEQALRIRFLDEHQGVIVLVDPQGGKHTIAFDGYEELLKTVDKRCRGKKDTAWLLHVGAGGEAIRFDGMLATLIDWARALGLLFGQRNQLAEKVLANLRNRVAHPVEHERTHPRDAHRTLADLGEIINHLWGNATPGGRLYPERAPRQVVAIAWTPDASKSMATLAENLLWPSAEDDDMQYAIVRADFIGPHADPNLMSFGSLHEATRYPVDLLWGPGNQSEAAAWYAENRPEPDTTGYLDRLFAVRVHDGQIYLPMRPQVAASVTGADRDGRWFAIHADFPQDAFAHVRLLLNKSEGCAAEGFCYSCLVETRTSGDYVDIVAAITGPVTPLTAIRDLRTSRAERRSWPVTP